MLIIDHADQPGDPLSIRPLLDDPRLRTAMGLDPISLGADAAPAAAAVQPAAAAPVIAATKQGRRKPSNSSAPADSGRMKTRNRRKHPRFDRRALLEPRD